MKRAAFTLVELLITITIISILAGLGLVALGNATESAKSDRTKASIAKINAIIMRRWTELQTRRLQLSISPEQYTDMNGDGVWQPGENFIDSNGNGQCDSYIPIELAAARLNAVRELMKYELPDRLSEITAATASVDVYPIKAGTAILPQSSLSKNFQRKLATATPQYESPECLYLIVMSDPDDAQQFRSDESDDVDHDGAKEFIDGWGHPIAFLRWPVGYVSDMQPLYTSATPPKATLDRTLGTRTGGGVTAVDHDPFDTRQVDATAFRTVPLIYSRGSSGIDSINIDKDPLYEYNTFKYPPVAPKPPYVQRNISLFDIYLWKNQEYGNKQGDDDAKGAKSLGIVTNHDLGTR